MITVDKKQGIAVDHAEVWLDGDEVGINVVVTMQLEDDDVLSLSYELEPDDKTTVYIPLERLRKLLAK
jgi:hypothetical protein